MGIKGLLPCFAALLLSGFCVAVPASTSANLGICWSIGNPHFRTFDGRYINFMRNCTYVMAKNCHVDKDHPSFEVDAKNDKQANSLVSSAGLVVIKVYGVTISLVQSKTGFVRVNNVEWSLPVSINNDKVVLAQNGLSVVLATDFGLTVRYDWNQYLVVTVPASFTGRTCGLCGNFNGKPEDDLDTPSGSQASNVPALGKSLKVPGMAGEAFCQEGCSGKCKTCQSSLLNHWKGELFCGILTDIMDGPFKSCSAVIDPSIYHQICMYDVCMGEGMRQYLCDTLQVYTDACQRAGIKVFDWRKLAGCSNPTCPENSQYELCGNACPATCENPTAPSKCKADCVETCTCNPGYVRSGNKCVLPSQCGCEYQGRYVQAGISFWGDNNCSKKCSCSKTGGKVVCEETSCPIGKQCQVINGTRDCYPGKNGICTISGDPHYNTFDKKKYDFQGTCTYTAAKACHLEGTNLTPFTVVVENEKWYPMVVNKTVSVAKLVAVEVYGNILILRKNQIGMIMVNGILTNLPLNLNNGAVEAYQEGTYDVIKTDFGLVIKYDLVFHVLITVPTNYQGKTCGLCGNFNNDKNDDFQLPDGKATKDLMTFGAAWKVSVPGVVCDDGCSGDFCPKCEEKKKVVFEGDCSIITNPQGPLAVCHNIIDPDSYFRDCVYDVCLSEGNQKVICHSVAAYVTDCQDFGVDIKGWRTEKFCPLPCPANSHYQICADTCVTTCPGLSETINCPLACAEGCACNSGYYFNGTGCVSRDQCSCYSDGRTYRIGESVISEDCHSVCTCQASGSVVCESTSCKSDDSCQIKSGVRGCYPRQCQLEAGGNFKLFSGLGGPITNMGAYEIVKICDQSLVSEWFRVVVDVQMCGDTVSVIAIYTFFEDMVVTVNDEHETWMNGRRLNLPSKLGSEISVRISDQTIIIEKTSGLYVSYSLSQEVTVTVAAHLADKVCGACGKSTGSETFTSSSLQQYMNSWRAPDFPSCSV